MENRIVYVHGKGGSVEEEHFKPLFPESEIIGFDYRSQTPWEAGEEFPAFFGCAAAVLRLPHADRKQHRRLFLALRAG